MPGNAIKLEPWDTVSQQEEGLPQVSGASPGFWGRAGSPDSATRPTTGLCGLECDEPPPPGKVSPNLRQRFVLANRDKESLLEEIIDLKRALSDQAYHLKLHKVHYTAVQLENRKLEKDVEDLEVCGNLEAPRTGGPTRLRAKLQGLRTRLGDLQATCDLQHDELCLLRRDIRVAHTRECEVERDVYAAEICRLQKVVKRLKALQLKITNENQELSRLKDKAARLKLANQRLESCIIIAQKTLEKANKEVVAFRAKAQESSYEAKKSATKMKELQEHATKLEALLEKERIEKRAIDLKIKDIARKKKEWDRKWEADQKRKQMASAAELLQKAKKRKKPEVAKDKGAHATASSSSDGSSDSDDGKETMLDKKRKKELFEARKRETLEKLEQRKNQMLKKVKDLSHAFVTEEQKHYDKVIAHASSSTSVSSLSPKDQQKQQDIERSLYQGVDVATLDFMDEVEDIHYGSKIPEPNLADLSAREIEQAKAKHAKDAAEALEKRKKERGETGSRPGSPSSGTTGTSGTTSGYSDDSSSDDSDGQSGISGQSVGSSLSRKDREFRKDREGGKNGKKMNAQEFEDRKAQFLSKAKKASHIFIEKEQAHYDKILSEVESGVRTQGSVGWFSSTSSISSEDKEKEQVHENEFCESVETAADEFLDRMEEVQYGGKGKVPRLKLQELRAQENAARQAREREERMHQAELEERARKKAEKEAAERWTSGQNKVEVMIDKAKLEDDEYSAEVKEVKGRLSVEINLKRTDDHPYVGSPRALEEERVRREEEARQARQAQEKAEYERRMQEEAEEREREMQRQIQAKEMEAQIELQREQYRGLSLAENRRRQELEAKLASGIPLTDEEAAELAALHARMRGKSGLTISEEARMKELEAKIAAGIPLSDAEEAEFKALKARFRGTSGLTSLEEARLKELEAKIAAGIPLTPEEEGELRALKSRLLRKSGLTAREEARLRELQAKIKSGIPLTDDEEAELRDLMGDLIKKSGLTGREEDRLKELEAKLKSGIPLSASEEAELKLLRSKIIRSSGLTIGQESRLKDLEEKLKNGIPLTDEEQAELNLLRSLLRGTSGLTRGEEDRLKELEEKLRSGIPLSAEEEAELKKLQKKFKSPLTSAEEERRKELEAKLAAGIQLTEEEERELRELQAKRWGEWPLSASEDARRKELEEKLRNGIELTPEEEAELRALQAKIKLKFPNAELGEVDMSRSEEMRKRGKLPFIDKEMQGFIKENIRGVLGHLENITEVIIAKQEKLKHESEHTAALAETSGAAMDALKGFDRDHGDKSKGGSRPGTPRGEKPHSPHDAKGEHSRFDKKKDEES